MAERALRSVVLVLVLTLVMAACSGSDGGVGSGDSGSATTGTGSGGEGTGSEAELEQAATDMFQAYLGGDDQTYFDYLSRSCRERLEFAAVEGHLSGRRFRAEGAGIDLGQLGVASVEITGYSGDLATVALTLSGTSETFEESLPGTWVYEEGGWHRDECSNISESQGGLEGYGTDRDEPVPYGGVADVNGWLIAVTAIQPDGEAFVVELGGEPASSGNQLFTVGLSLTYNGADASTVLGDDLAFAMVARSAEYADEADCGSDDPAFLDLGVRSGPGDDIGFPQLCREVSESDADELLLRVTDLDSGTDYWFDLSQP